MKMNALKDFDDVYNSLRSSAKNSIVALHKFVFGNEGDRGNRKRLREFTGFDCKIDSEPYAVRMKYITENLSPADLISICNILGLDYSKDDLAKHIFKNLTQNELLQDVVTGDDVDDLEDESDEEENNDNILSRSNDDVEAMGSVSVHNDEGAHMLRRLSLKSDVRRNDDRKCNTPRFALNFRDVEDFITTYDGSGSVSIKTWINEFEEMSELMQWDGLQNIIVAKKSLKGIAKMFIESTHGLNSWQKIKSALLKEFGGYMDSGQLHKLLCERKINRGESILEYFYTMKKIASQGNVEDSALFNYVIDGIRDMNENKSILYGAKNSEEFKAKITQYEIFSSKLKSVKEPRPKVDVPKLNTAFNDQERNSSLTCFNCGRKGHQSSMCPDKEKGQKCFCCNQYGHISRNCPKKKTESTTINMRLVEAVQDDVTVYTKILQNTYKTLFDTGSKFNIMTEKVYSDLGRPELLNTNVKLCGFGAKISGNTIAPLGKLSLKIEINNEEYIENFLVVKTECLDIPLLLGLEFTNDKIIQFNGNKVHFSKKVKSENDDHAEVIQIMTINQDEEAELNIDPTASVQARREVTNLINNNKVKKDALRDAEEAKVAKEELQAVSKNAERKVKALEAKIMQLTEDLASSERARRTAETERDELVEEIAANGSKSSLIIECYENERSELSEDARANLLEIQEENRKTYDRKRNRAKKYGGKMKLKEDLRIKELVEEEIREAFNDDRNEMRQEAKRNILKMQEENRRGYNKKRKPAKLYLPGELVAIKRTQLGGGLKLRPKYLGLYEITRVKKNNTYDVRKIGVGDGPIYTTTCAEYMIPWPETENPFETNE